MFHGVFRQSSTLQLVNHVLEFLFCSNEVFADSLIYTDTTANTLAALTYHLLSNPEILKKLKVELSKAVPDPESTLELSQLEALPYLTAVIEEGIRLHPGASVRQDRVAPDEDLFYEDSKNGKKYVIPRGVSFPFPKLIEGV